MIAFDSAPLNSVISPAFFPGAHFDNASEAEPAAFLACYLLPPGEDRLIEML